MKKYKFHKIVALIIGVLLACVPFAGCAGSDPADRTTTQVYKGMELINDDTQYVISQKGTPAPVYSVGFDIMGGKDVMPIGGWWGPYDPKEKVINGVELPNYVNDYYFRLIKEAGVNFTVVAPETYDQNSANVMKALDLSEKYGMGYFVYDPQVNNVSKLDSMEERLSLYINHPACIGVHSQDEPGAIHFDNIKAIYDKFNTLGYKDKYLYTNLLPNYATSLLSGTGEIMSYENYIKQFADKVNQGYLSFDYYPFTRPNVGTSGMKNYFEQLSVVRKVSQDHGIPFWTFIQLGAQWNDSGTPRDIVYPLYPSEAETYWNINTSLAYGAKALEYFCMFQPVNYMYTLDGFNFEHLAMFGAAGNINSWYYYAQNANKQIQAIDEVLMNASSQGIIAVGGIADQNVTGSEKLNDGKFRQLTSAVGTDNANAIIGCFDYKGGTALYIVNYSVTEKCEYTLHFDNKYGYDVTQRGRTVSVAGESVTLVLEAGEGVLVTLR